METNYNTVSFFLQVVSHFSQHHLLKRLSFSPNCVFLAPCQKLSAHISCHFIFGLTIMFPWPVCMFFCQYHASLTIIALLYDSKSLPAFLGLLWLFYLFCGPIQNGWCLVQFLMGTAVKLSVTLGNVAILTMLILPTHEHKIFPILLYIFKQCFVVFSIWVFMSFLSFIPSYLIFWVTISKWIFSQFFFSWTFVVSIQEGSEFLYIDLYTATLLYYYMFIVFNTLFVWIL